jgi:glycosyltransferase 2 family protein
MKKHIEIWIKLIVSFAIISVIFFSIDFKEFLKLLTRINILYLLLLLPLVPISIFIRAWRWHYLFNYDQEKKIKLSFAIKLTFVGMGLNIFMPSQAGEVFKAYFGYQWSGIKERMFIVSLFDKLIAIGSIGFLGIIPSIYYSNIWFLLGSLAAFVPLLIFLILLKNKRIFKKWKPRADKLLNGNMNVDLTMRAIRADPVVLFKSLLLSLVAWLFSYVILWMCFKMVTPTLTINPSLFFVFMLAPVLTLGRLFPFTLNGLGTDEALIIFLFKMIEIPPEISFGAALLFKFILIILPGLAGLYFIVSSKKQIHIKKAENYV